MKNPFHYFAPFKNTREDRKKFFGRRNEESQLVNVFRRSPISVVTGPSGSGKTSLIECGLFQRLGILNHEVYKVRFDKDEHAGSLLIKLFASWDIELSYIYSLLLKNYAEPDNLVYFLRDGSDEKIFLHAIQNEDAAKDLEEIIDGDKYPLFLDVLTAEIAKNKNGYDYNYREDIDDLVKKSLKITFDKRLRNLANEKWGGNRFLLFDQFEEFYSLRGYSDIEKRTALDIDGHQIKIEEVDAVGILVSTILERLSPFHIIISFKEEYLGSFESFVKWIPNLHRRKFRIGLPAKEEIEDDILIKYFEKFNIRLEDGVLDHILKEVRKLGTIGQYQLPFMQMYLYELFDYAVANDHIEDGTVILRSSGVQKYKGIKDIVGKKVNKISIRLRNKVHIDAGILLSISEVRDFTIRVLREFKTEGDSKRRYKYVEGELADFDLTGIDKNHVLMGFMPYCVMELVDEKLVRHEEEDQYLELAHDTLSEIIDHFGIGKDYLEILQENFDSNYELYLASKSSDNKTHLISQSLMSRIVEDDLRILITEKDGTIHSGKKEFWEESYRYNRRKEIRAKRIRFLVFTGLLICLLMSLYFLLEAHKARENSEIARGDTEIARENTEIEKLQNLVESIILEKLGKAYSEGKTDPTASSKLKKIDRNEIDSLVILNRNIPLKLLSLEKVIKDYSLIRRQKDSILTNKINEKVDSIINGLDNNGKFAIRRQYFEDLVGNTGIIPFYVNHAELKNQHILMSKSRILKTCEDTLLIFIKTRDSLHLFKANLKNHSEILKVSKKFENEEFSTFEPYYNNDSIKILVSSGAKLLVLNEKLEQEMDLSNPGHYYLQTIEGLEDNNFLCLSSDKKTLRLYNSISQKYSSFDFLDSFDIAEINFITYLKERKEFILGAKINDKKTNEKNDWIFRIDSKNRIGRKTFDGVKSIKSIKVLENGDIFFSDANSIYKVKASDISNVSVVQKYALPIIVHNDYDNKEIKTIDTDGTRFIIGTQGNIAHTYFNRGSTFKTALHVQKLIGHSDDIVNVSYIRNGDFALSTSREGNIKIWDVGYKPMNSSVINPKNDGISQLTFKDSSLFVAFRFINSLDKYGPGFIGELNDTLGKIREYYYRGSLKEEYKTIEMPSFDFERDTNIVAGTHWRQEIRNAQVKGSMDESIQPETSSTVRDIRVVDSLMVVATDDGIDIFIKIDDKFVRQTLPQMFTAKIQINAVDVHKKAGKIIGAGENGNVYVWNLDDHTLISELHEHHDKVTDVCFSPDGVFFVSSSWDNKAIIWSDLGETGKYEEKFKIDVHFNDIEDVDITQIDSTYLIASASSDNTVQMHRVRRKDNDDLIIARIPSLINNNGISIRAVTFGESDSILYTGDKKGIIKKWDISESLKLRR